MKTRISERDNFAYLTIALVVFLLLAAALHQLTESALGARLLEGATVLTLIAGYGDITPMSPLARYLAFMEGIVGQFYIATLVATLVGVRVSKWQQG